MNSAVDPSARPALMELTDVTVARAGRVVLRDVTFSLAPGEFAAMIGSNGSGKTTLLRVMLGLQRVERGSVIFEGRTSSHARRAIGYVPQKIVFDADVPLRARDFVALGVDGERFGWRRHGRQRDASVAAILESVGAHSFAHRRIGSLSGGEQQRVLLAHALVSQPRLLLLDEPLANLDPGNGQEIIDLLRRVATTHGVAVLLSSHDMNPLLPSVDRLVYVANQRVASGTVDEVVRPDVLTSLYGSHVDVVRVHGRVLVVTGSAELNEIAEHPDVVVE